MAMASHNPLSPRVTLQPGQLTKPEKVWASSNSLIIGFYQAAPYSDLFKIFYKKSGSVFGTQVTITPASVLGPELAVQHVYGEAQYFEYEIKKLKPSTQYIVKIKSGDDASENRSEKIGTISVEEERTRDNDMANFKGALVQLGEYDGLVTHFAPESGIFSVRILQVDDLSRATQLARLASVYSDGGLPVQAYTLSHIKFGRWGGEITGSKVVNEAELKWLVARAVQVADKSDAHAAYEARSRLMQAQVDKVTAGLEAEWTSKLRRLKLRAVLYLLLASVLAVGAGAGIGLTLRRAARRQRSLEEALGVATGRAAELEEQLQILALYRVSLELDMGRRLAGEGDPWVQGAPAAAGAAATGNRSNATLLQPNQQQHQHRSDSKHSRHRHGPTGESSLGAEAADVQQGAAQRQQRRAGGSGGSASGSSSKQGGRGSSSRGAGGSAGGGGSRGSSRRAADGSGGRAGGWERHGGSSSSSGKDGQQQQPHYSPLSRGALRRALLRSHDPLTYGLGRPGGWVQGRGRDVGWLGGGEDQRAGPAPVGWPQQRA